MTSAHLFSPLRIRRREVRNRIALPATLTNYGAAHRVTARWIDFLAACATRWRTISPTSTAA